MLYYTDPIKMLLNTLYTNKEKIDVAIDRSDENVLLETTLDNNNNKINVVFDKSNQDDHYRHHIIIMKILMLY